VAMAVIPAEFGFGSELKPADGIWKGGSGGRGSGNLKAPVHGGQQGLEDLAGQPADRGNRDAIPGHVQGRRDGLRQTIGFRQAHEAGRFPGTDQARADLATVHQDQGLA